MLPTIPDFCLLLSRIVYSSSVYHFEHSIFLALKDKVLHRPVEVATQKRYSRATNLYECYELEKKVAEMELSRRGLEEKEGLF